MKTQDEKAPKNSWLQNFPIMFYTVVMGLGGLALAYERLNLIFGISGWIFEILRWMASLAYTVISALYAAKLIRYPQAFTAEFSHPVRVNFFATFSVSTLLIAALWKDFTPVYDVLFYVGIVFQGIISLYVVSFWIKNNILISHSNPAWFIPIVGNLLVPLAAPAGSELAWYYFGVGIFFWPVLFAVLFYRIIFHDQMPQKFIPTLFIVIAPPAMAFLDYTKLTANFDAPAKIMLYVTLFFALLILFMFKSFLRLKFFLSWWAFTFPTAAASIALLRAYELSGLKFFLLAGSAGFAILCVFIGIVGFYTTKAILRAEICVAE